MTKQQIEKYIAYGKQNKFLKKKFLLEFPDANIEQTYLFFHDKTTPICPGCNNPKPFISFTRGYKPQKFCSHSCYLDNTDIVQKVREESCLEKHGNKNFGRSDKANKNRKETNLELYGSENVFGSTIIQEKIQETWIENYGETNPNKSRIVRQKVEDTNMKRYNMKCSRQSDQAKETRTKTLIERYGDDYQLYMNNKVKEAKAAWSDEKRLEVGDNMRAYHDKKYENYLYQDYTKDKAIYHKLCWWYTNKNDLSVLPNIEKRAAVEHEGAYHLDHMFSIHEGFLQGIQPWVIGSIKNLCMIPAIENLSKNSKCSISFEELYK